MIADFHATSTGTVWKHLLALRDISRFDVEIAHVGTVARFNIDLKAYGIIVIHYSIVVAFGYQLGPRLRAGLAAARALKIVFIQDEYRWIDATAEAIRELGVTVLFTVVNPEIVDQVYHHPWMKNVRKEITLTGFVDEAILGLDLPTYESRKVDVAYRARKVPYWLGSFAMEKWSIGKKFRAQAERLGLCHDISNDESARIYGSKWIEFLSNSKAVLGTESGASICDFSGEVRTRVEAAVEAEPNIGFDRVREEILQDNDGRIVIHVISPRIFEAAALKTLMINYPGDYSGKLIPWRHYVPLAKDHSNIDEVAQVIRDPDKANKIIDAAYREVACNPDNSFRAMVAHFDTVVEQELPSAKVNSATPRDHRRGLEMTSWADFYTRRFVRATRKLTWKAAKSVLPARVVVSIETRFAK